jgi:hypothetical protein
MRLIDVSSLLLVESTGEDKPAYAILSHTWDHGSEEVLFEDIQGGSNWTHKKGAKKILGACTQASTDGHRFLWVDTCCMAPFTEN